MWSNALTVADEGVISIPMGANALVSPDLNFNSGGSNLGTGLRHKTGDDIAVRDRIAADRNPLMALSYSIQS
jgi:hypothetical protein